MTEETKTPDSAPAGVSDSTQLLGVGTCGHFCEACARRDDRIKKFRGLLLWALYNHQGGSSTIGQPIRAALGIGTHDSMTHEQVVEAQIAAGIR